MKPMADFARLSACRRAIPGYYLGGLVVLFLGCSLATSGHPKDADLQKYLDALRSRIEPLRTANALRPARFDERS